MERIVPRTASDVVVSTYEKKLMFMDTGIAESPSLSIRNAHREISRIQKIANETLELALEAFFEKDPDKAKKALRNEKVINYLTRKTSSKLVKITDTNQSRYSKRVAKMFRIVFDIERIGDHAENIAEYTAHVIENELVFSDAAIEELKQLSELTTSLTSQAHVVFEKYDPSHVPQIKTLEKTIDKLRQDFTENHINRLNNEFCEPRSGVVFTDMIIDLERCADHANNIASTMFPRRKQNKTKSNNNQNREPNPPSNS